MKKNDKFEHTRTGVLLFQELEVKPLWSEKSWDLWLKSVEITEGEIDPFELVNGSLKEVK